MFYCSSAKLQCFKKTRFYDQSSYPLSKFERRNEEENSNGGKEERSFTTII